MSDHIEKRTAELRERTKAELVNEIINVELNALVGQYADYEEGDDAEGKRVPYVGWIWRNVDFAGGDYTIGDCRDFIGFMAVNKWDYPQRRLTPDEAAQVRKLVCDAAESGDEITTKATLAKLWPLLQSFPMTVEGFWIVGPQGNVGFAKTAEDAEKTIAALTDAAPAFEYRMVPA